MAEPNKVSPVSLKQLIPIPTGIEPRGELNGPVTCVLFDIYGTLFISGSGDIAVSEKHTPSHAAIAAILNRFGWRLAPQEATRALHHAIKHEHARLREGGEAHPEVVIERIWMQVLECSDTPRVREFALEFELVVNPVWPMPHLKSMLKALKESRIVLGIISNAQFYTPLLFEWFLGQDLDRLGFDPNLRIFSYQCGCAKPSPRIFQIALENMARMGIDPRQTVYVGNDMCNDILGARRAGLQTALFAGDKRSLRLRGNDPRCRDVTPDVILTDLDQIEDHLANANQCPTN
jgi:putative hydrolase of the HAD superfamily